MISQLIFSLRGMMASKLCEMLTNHSKWSIVGQKANIFIFWYGQVHWKAMGKDLRTS